MSKAINYETFDTRLKEREEELRYLFNELYHDDNAYAYFVSMLKRMYGERSNALKKWDEKKDPG